MRYINYSLYSPSPTWLRKASDKTAEMVAAWETQDPALSEIKQAMIKLRYWAELKEELSSVSNNKCWYCESIVDREYGAVDHFRPKSVRNPEGSYHGYWWLIFDFKNYRFSCTLCNSPLDGHGKHDHFPLLEEANRACQPTSDCTNELPMLLDPTVEADTQLIYTERSGEFIPIGRDNKDVIGLERARISIHLYHLNKATTRNKRRSIMQSIDKIFDDYKLMSSILAEMWSYRKQPEARRKMNALCSKMRDFREELLNAISPSSEFSVPAATILLLRRGDFEWIDGILFKAELLPSGASAE